MGKHAHGPAALCGPFPLLIAMALSAPAAAQTSQANGLAIKQVSSPGPGRVQVLAAAAAPHDAAIGASPQARDFTLWLGDGAARDVAVARNGARSRPLTTIILLDESGSYRKGPGRSEGRPAIESYVKSMPAGDEVGLVAFATDVKKYAIRTAAADFLGDLANAASMDLGGNTKLLAGLGTAIDWAVAEGEPGLREVILFSDAGDETKLDQKLWQAMLDSAEARGVRVSVVLPAAQRAPGGVDPKDWLLITTYLTDLSRRTSGLYDTSGNLQAIVGALASARTEFRSWLVLEGGLCGLRPGQTSVGVRVDYAPGAARQAWSADATLPTPTLAAGSEQACPSRACSASSPCPGGAQCVAGRCEAVCQPACEAWQSCQAGGCVARTCTVAEECSPGTCENGRCAADRRPFWKTPLAWAVTGAGLLLLALLLWLVLRQKHKTQPEAQPAPEPVVVPPPAPPEPQFEPRSSGFTAPVLDPLPETHLKAIGGWPVAGERWRLTKTKMQVGGAPDPDLQNDIVFGLRQISGRHAMFELYPSGALWLTDLGSSNGTFINGRRLGHKERAPLNVGDIVKLSQHLTLEVVRPGFEGTRPAAAAAAPAAAAPAAPQAQAKKATKFDPGNR